MSTSPLILKNPRGWFAAGTEVQKALTILSDGAFKLFVHLCLNARRDTGVLETTQTDLARALKKTNHTIRIYLREMESAGVCQTHFSRHPFARGVIQIAEAFWPYQRTDGETAPQEGSDPFVSEIRKMLQARACVQSSLSVADEIEAQKIQPDYWAYLRYRLKRMEALWREAHSKSVPSADERASAGKPGVGP